MMDVSDDNHLWVSWDHYHHAIEQLVALVHESGWAFDQILCLARGGLRIGDVFSRVFQVPLAIMSTSSYREDAGTQRGELNIARHITMPTGTLAGKILLIDDLVDSGITLENVRSHLQMNFPAISEIKTAVLWHKSCSSIQPDYAVETLSTNPWIHQPFEEYDRIRPAQIAAKLKLRDGS